MIALMTGAAALTGKMMRLPPLLSLLQLGRWRVDDYFTELMMTLHSAVWSFLRHRKLNLRDDEAAWLIK